jgi:hypothetical protein
MPEFFPPQPLRDVPVGEAFIFHGSEWDQGTAREVYDSGIVYIKLTDDRLWSNLYGGFNNIGSTELDRPVKIVRGN